MLRCAAARCGYGTSAAMDVHEPHARQWDTPVGLGTSSHGGTIAATVDTFQGHGDKDDDEEAKEHGYDELAESQL